MTTQNRWDAAEIERLKQLLIEEKTIKEIAIELNRSYNSVESYIHKNKLRKCKIRINKKWKDSEIKILTKLYYNYVPAKIISEKLNRTTVR